MKPLALFATLVATPAFAHVGSATHAHPHGGEAVVIGLAIVALNWMRWAR
jgi:hypothetical protein